MAHNHRFDVRAPALLTSLALLASPLACQSDEQDDTADGATTEVDSLTMGNAVSGASAGTSSSGNAPASAANATQPPPAPSPAPIAPASSPIESGATPAVVGSADAAPALAFAACTYSEGTYGRNCDFVYVSMKQVSPARCVQLTFDNCGEYSSRGLSVDVPRPWVLDSGTVSSDPDECELGVYYPTSSVALRASGEVSWNETTRLPSELVLDVTLVTSTSATDAGVELTTTAPLTPSVCDD